MASMQKRGRPSRQTESAKKRKKLDADQQRNKAKVYIGDALDRWNALKEEKGFVHHYEVARLLLDSYENMQRTAAALTVIPEKTPVHPSPTYEHTHSTLTSSTPQILPGTSRQSSFPVEMSEISSEKSRDVESEESSLSGVELMNVQRTDLIVTQRKKTQESGRKRQLHGSFLDPFELSIDITDEEFDDDDKDDEEYQPSFNITIGPSVGSDIVEDVSIGEVEFGDQDEDDEVDEEEIEADLGSGVFRVSSEDEIKYVTGDTDVFLAYLKPIYRLAEVKVPEECVEVNCSLQVHLNHTFVGSALYLKWACPSGHETYKWCSQPVLNRRMHGGDLMLSAAILASGNNFEKMSLFARLLHLHFISKSAYYRIQTTYLTPCIEKMWEDHQREVLENLKDKDIVILGDGRMDSPGHSAQYCSYTVMENETKKILTVITMDKRETERKSTNLEKACFQKAMVEMRGKQMKVVEVVTDSHLQIGSVMKKEYPAVKHSHDIWHAAKNLGKKIIAAGQEKNCRPLLEWTQHIVNHFWYSCQKADSREEFIGIWLSVMHHVTNEHEWLVPISGPGTDHCDHGPLVEEERKTEWLKKGSDAHEALRKLVFDVRLLNKIPYFLNFRSTSELENFQQHILMYAAKRFAYTPPVYRARNLLAAIDYNSNLGRPVKQAADGSTRYHRLYNKKSKRWTVVPIKADKSYKHIQALMESIVKTRLEDQVGVSRKKVLSLTDPRRISTHLAPISPPSTKEIAEQKVSRMK